MLCAERRVVVSASVAQAADESNTGVTGLARAASASGDCPQRSGENLISVEHAEAVCRQRFVRRLGVVCARENARLRLRGLTFLDTHGKVRPYINPYCERHWRLRQDAAVHWRLRRL